VRFSISAKVTCNWYYELFLYFKRASIGIAMGDIGYIYFLTNPAMPGLLKIGFTKGSLEERLKQLSTSGVPHPFQLGAAFRVSGPAECEREIHSFLASQRLNRDREFFQVALPSAITSVVPILTSHFVDDDAPGDSAGVSSEAIDPTDELTLQILAHDYPNGATVQQLIDSGHPDHPLELRLRLVRFLEKGFVAEKANRRLDALWRLTNEGLKFMFQNNIILKELIEDEKRVKKEMGGRDPR
jgi:hypothetical protein